MRGKLLFFSILDLHPIDPMYKFSLGWYKMLFTRAFEMLGHYKTFEERKLGIIHHVTMMIYQNVCMSLFEKHKMLFSFIVSLKMQKLQSLVDEQEWSFFLNLQHDLAPAARSQFPFIPENWWSEIVGNIEVIRKLPGWGDLDRLCFEENKELFVRFFHDPEPYSCEEFFQRLGKHGFQRLVVIKIFRPDKHDKAIPNYILEVMGREYIIPPNMEIEHLFNFSSKQTPLIFLLTTGSDPRENFLRFAEDKLMSRRLQIISLGQGMGPKAELKIKNAQKKGEWILLENCHLASSWMSDLDRISHEIDKNAHKDFRYCSSKSISRYIF